jgi:N-acyl-D-amino-acid deacylase
MLRPFVLALVLFGWLAGCAIVTPPPAYDLVIRNGRVVDGTGAPAVKADVGVRDGRIVTIGQITGTARTEIDAAGKVVAPGFIDVHTHSEEVTEVPLAENFLRMGVTTIIAGNCGSSKTDIAGFFSDVTRTGVAINVATLVGQGSVRAQVMGGSFMRPPTPAEVEQMRALVDRAMRDGAVGLSTGLIYLPGTFSKTAEIIEMAKVAAAHGGIYTSHMRHENTQIVDAINELLAVARGAHIRAEVSHIKLSGPAAWGRADEILALLAKARAEGIEVTQDQYVYTASSTGISALVEASAREGGTKQFIERMKDPARKAAVVAEMKESLRNSKRADFSYAVIANYSANPALNGKTVPQAAKMVRGADALDDQIELVLDITAHGGAQGVFHGMSEEDLQKFLVHPLTMIASDSGMRKFGEDVPHPRGYGNNARVLARYVRELKVLTLEDAVRKMSSLPAHTFHLKHRGELKPGNIADVVVFDPATVADVSTFSDPHHYAVGFSDVVVNGTPVIRDAKITGARPGKPVHLQDE